MVMVTVVMTVIAMMLLAMITKRLRPGPFGRCCESCAKAGQAAAKAGVCHYHAYDQYVLRAAKGEHYQSKSRPIGKGATGPRGVPYKASDSALRNFL